MPNYRVYIDTPTVLTDEELRELEDCIKDSTDEIIDLAKITAQYD